MTLLAPRDVGRRLSLSTSRVIQLIGKAYFPPCATAPAAGFEFHGNRLCATAAGEEGDESEGHAGETHATPHGQEEGTPIAQP